MYIIYINIHNRERFGSLPQGFDRHILVKKDFVVFFNGVVILRDFDQGAMGVLLFPSQKI